MNQPATPATPPVRPPPPMHRITEYIVGNVKLEELMPITPGSILPLTKPARYTALIDTLVDVGAPSPIPLKDLRIPLPLATDLAKAYEIICDQELFAGMAQTAADAEIDRRIKQHQGRQAQKPLIQVAKDLPPGAHGG